MRANYKIVQDGVTVVRVGGNDRDRAKDELFRYIAQYHQDGPMQVFDGRRRARELEPVFVG